MISLASRVIGYRIAIYCEENKPGYGLYWTDIPDDANIENGFYQRVMAWEGPRDPFLKNLDKALTKKYSPPKAVSKAFRADVCQAFYQFRTVLYVHKNLDKCPLDGGDIGIDSHLWEAAKRGEYAFSPERYLALRFAIEAEDWVDAYYLYFRIMVNIAAQDETYRLNARWIEGIPMSKFLEGLDEPTRGAILKNHENGKRKFMKEQDKRAFARESLRGEEEKDF